MKATTINKGDVSVLRVAAALIASGERVLKPVSDGERYDLAVDRQGTLYRIQVKAGRYRRGAVVFNTCSTRGGRKGYIGHVEAFGVFCSETDSVYLIPIEYVAQKANMTLRINAAKNGMKKRINAASEFKI